MYVVVVCNKCKKPSVASLSHKTRRCPYCESRINILESKIVAKTISAEEAKMILVKEKKRMFNLRKLRNTSD